MYGEQCKTRILGSHLARKILALALVELAGSGCYKDLPHQALALLTTLQTLQSGMFASSEERSIGRACWPRMLHGPTTQRTGLLENLAKLGFGEASTLGKSWPWQSLLA